jgi:hypothetical protein
MDYTFDFCHKIYRHKFVKKKVKVKIKHKVMGQIPNSPLLLTRVKPHIFY